MKPSNDFVQSIFELANLHAHERGYDVVFMYLNGSQNYGLDTPESDFDFTCVVAPSLEYEAIHTKAEINDIIKYEHGLLKMRDFRSYFLNDIPKSSLVTLEVFASQSVIWQHKYAVPVTEFMSNAQAFMYADPRRAIDAALGYAQQMRNRIFKEEEKHYNPELGYNPKYFCHYMRAYCWILKYIKHTEKTIDIEQLYDENNYLLLDAKNGKMPKNSVVDFIEALSIYDKKCKTKTDSEIAKLTSEQANILKDILKEICIEIARIAWERKEEE